MAIKRTEADAARDTDDYPKEERGRNWHRTQRQEVYQSWRTHGPTFDKATEFVTYDHLANNIVWEIVGILPRPDDDKGVESIAVDATGAVLITPVVDPGFFAAKSVVTCLMGILQPDNTSVARLSNGLGNAEVYSDPVNRWFDMTGLSDVFNWPAGFDPTQRYELSFQLEIDEAGTSAVVRCSVNGTEIIEGAPRTLAAPFEALQTRALLANVSTNTSLSGLIIYHWQIERRMLMSGTAIETRMYLDERCGSVTESQPDDAIVRSGALQPGARWAHAIYGDTCETVIAGEPLTTRVAVPMPDSIGDWTWEAVNFPEANSINLNSADDAWQCRGTAQVIWGLVPDLSCEDQWAEWEISNPSLYGHDWGVCLRHEAGTESCYFVDYQPTTDFRIFRRDASGTVSLIGTFVPTGGTMSNETYRLEVSGTDPVQVRMRKGSGGAWTTYEDSAANRVVTGTRAGLYSHALSTRVALIKRQRYGVL